jgi:hypothetical protein
MLDIGASGGVNVSSKKVSANKRYIIVSIRTNGRVAGSRGGASCPVLPSLLDDLAKAEHALRHVVLSGQISQLYTTSSSKLQVAGSSVRRPAE